MSTVLQNVENGTSLKKRMHIKGASEFVLLSCDKFLDWEND